MKKMDSQLSAEDIDKIRAIMKAFFGHSVASGFTESSVTEETVRAIAHMLVETVDCSRWVDAVPSPQDLLRPTRRITKWALRLIREAGKPFLQNEVKVSWICRTVRSGQFRSSIETTLR